MLRYKTKEEFEQNPSIEFSKRGSARHVCSMVVVLSEYFGTPCNPTDALEPWMTTTDPLPAPKTAERYNSGKVDLSLIPVEATLQECRVWAFGAEKYDRDNWKQLWGDQTVNVVMASALRHMMAILDGEENDSETGLPHAAHVRCNMAMLLEYYKSQEK